MARKLLRIEFYTFSNPFVDPTDMIPNIMLRSHLLTIASIALFANLLLAQFTPNRLAVLEYAYTVTSPDPGGPLVIREFSTNGTPGVVLNVPSTGLNAVVSSFNTLAGGAMTLTPSGDKLVFTGYTTTAPAGIGLGTTSSVAIPRAVGTVNAQGNFARPVTTTFFSGGRINAVACDGTGYWAGGENSGVCYLGPGAPGVINSDQSNTSSLHVSNGQLFSQAGTSVYQIGTGTPVASSPQTPLFTYGSGAFDFQLSPDGNTCYTATTSSIKKWVRSGQTWTNVYNFSSPGWLIRILVDFSSTSPIVYGIHNLPTKLVKFIDTGAPGAEVILATNPNNANWFGLAFTPGTNCTVGTPCNDGIAATGNDVIGANCLCAGQLIDCMGMPGGSALPGSPCDDHDLNTGVDTWQVGCTCIGQKVLLSAKVILSGALPNTGTLMNDQLRSLASFPLTEPYSALGLAPTGGFTTINPAVLAIAGLNAIVDWVMVELRSVTTPSAVVVRRVALVQRDGDVVDLDGISALPIPAAQGTYMVALRHRNHLGVMTANGVALSVAETTVDFRLLTTATWGSGAERNMVSFQAMWSGDVQRDGLLLYTGPNNDRDPILVNVGSTTPNNSVVGYNSRDVNLSGVVSYTGLNNDRDPILVNVGSTTPNGTRAEQLP